MSASAQAKTDGGGDRVRCLYCGANNFPSSPTCWQCGRPLQALRPGPAGVEQAASRPPAMAATPSRPAAQADLVSPALAPKAAAALGLMFPYVGLPVGMVFLMLDDARKTQLGWITIGWSVAGTVLSVLLLLLTMGPTLALLKSLLPAGHGGGGLPNLPSPSGDGGDLNLFVPYIRHGFRQMFQAS